MPEWPDDLRQMHARHAGARPAVSRDFTPDDDLYLAAKLRQSGEGPDLLARVLGVPPAYALALFRAAAAE
jgi:hypothetical protein